MMRWLVILVDPRQGATRVVAQPLVIYLGGLTSRFVEGTTPRLQTPPVCKRNPVPFTYGTLTCFTQGEISLSGIWDPPPCPFANGGPICTRNMQCVPLCHRNTPSSSTTVAFVVSNIIVAVAATLSVVAVVYYKTKTEKKKSSSSSSPSDDTVTITLLPWATATSAPEIYQAVHDR